MDIPITREEALLLRLLLDEEMRAQNLADHLRPSVNHIRLFNKLGKAL